MLQQDARLLAARSDNNIGKSAAGAAADRCEAGGRDSIRAGHHGNVRGVSDEQLPARKPVKVKRERRRRRFAARPRHARRVA